MFKFMAALALAVAGGYGYKVKGAHSPIALAAAAGGGLMALIFGLALVPVGVRQMYGLHVTALFATVFFWMILQQVKKLLRKQTTAHKAALHMHPAALGLMIASIGMMV